MGHTKMFLFLWLMLSLSLTMFADNEYYQGRNLSDQSFYGRSLENANFNNCNLQGASLESTCIKNATFEDSDIRGASFFLCSYDIPNVNFYHPDNFRAEQIYATASYKQKDLTGVNLGDNFLSGWDFSGQNLTDVDFSWSYLGAISSDTFSDYGLDYPGLQKADFTDAIVNGANFREVTRKEFGSFSSDQLYSTLSYKRKDLSRIKLDGNDLSKWDFSEQNLQNSSFRTINQEDVTNLEGSNFAKADLRGADLSGAEGNPIYKNTIMTDGRIENFSMTSASDSLLIRKYEPGTSGGALISAKLDTSSTISGGAALALECGADFEITNNSTLSVAQGSAISINTDASSSTSFSILAGSRLVFENGAILKINLEGTFTADDSVSFVVFDWENGGNFEVIGDFIKDESVFLGLNGEKFDGDWNFKTEDNKFIVSISQVPEPAACAAIFGALTLLLALGKRKAHLAKSGR